MKYKQLPLTGEQNDFTDSLDELSNVVLLRQSLSKFYEDNKQYNPRQLHYIITQMSNDSKLDELVDWGIDVDNIK
jgi:hypothetical protein